MDSRRLHAADDGRDHRGADQVPGQLPVAQEIILRVFSPVASHIESDRQADEQVDNADGVIVEIEVERAIHEGALYQIRR